MLKLRLFGRFELTDSAGNALALPARKDQALLTILAVLDQVSREQVISLLWRDRGETQARKSLRQSLVVLRRALNSDGEVIASNSRQILSLAKDRIDLDVSHFNSLCRKDDVPALQAAAGFYQGELLPYFNIPAPNFCDWLDGQRRRFADLAFGVNTKLAEEYLRQNDWSDAETASRRLLDIDPFREVGHRFLMRALDGAGASCGSLATISQPFRIATR